MKNLWIVFAAAIFLYACSSPESLMKLTSASFSEGKPIPPSFTCDGADKAPTLNVADVPANAKSLILIMDDPDAPRGTWDHWILFNIAPSVQTINDKTAGVGGKNSWGRTGYGGPCPPSGTHRYFFKLYALDAMLDLKEGAARAAVEKAMQGHIVAEAKLMGTYQRK
jgi:Raf kinase inhibitor-like YbhB/YbcL family protein